MFGVYTLDKRHLSLLYNSLLVINNNCVEVLVRFFSSSLVLLSLLGVHVVSTHSNKWDNHQSNDTNHDIDHFLWEGLAVLNINNSCRLCFSVFFLLFFNIWGNSDLRWSCNALRLTGSWSGNWSKSDLGRGFLSNTNPRTQSWVNKLIWALRVVVHWAAIFTLFILEVSHQVSRNNISYFQFFNGSVVLCDQDLTVTWQFLNLDGWWWSSILSQFIFYSEAVEVVSVIIESCWKGGFSFVNFSFNNRFFKNSSICRTCSSLDYVVNFGSQSLINLSTWEIVLTSVNSSCWNIKWWWLWGF